MFYTIGSVAIACGLLVSSAFATPADILLRWDKTCSSLRSYDIRVSILRRTLLDGKHGWKPHSIPIKKEEWHRHVFSNGKHRIEKHATGFEHGPESIDIWNGYLSQYIQTDANLMSVDLKYRSPLPIDYEATYRTVQGLTNWTEMLRDRPLLDAEYPDATTATLYTPTISGNYEQSPFGFRVWIDITKNYLPKKIQYLMKIENEEVVRLQIETELRELEPGMWLPAEARVSSYRYLETTKQPMKVEESLYKVDVENSMFNEQVPDSVFEIRRMPDLESQIKRAFSKINVNERLSRLLEDSKLTHSQILLVVADPSSSLVLQLFVAQSPNLEYRTLQDAIQNYMLLGVALDQTAVIEQHGLVMPKKNNATLAVLDHYGKVVASTTFDELADAGILDLGRIAGFLKSHSVPFPDATQAFTTAVTKASREKKKIFVQLSGPQCVPCIQLSRYVESHKQLLLKEYVHLKLDSRMPNVNHIMRRLRSATGDGIPWMAILKSDGEVLITSDSEKGNIGYPSSEQHKSYFTHMIRSTSEHLTDAEIARLLAGFE